MLLLVSSSGCASSHSRLTPRSMNWLRKFSAGLFSLRLRVAFQWFLMALSVRPFSSLASAAHLLV